MVRFKKDRKKKDVSIRNSATENAGCLLEDSEQTSFSGLGNVNTEKRGEQYVSGCFPGDQRGMLVCVFLCV